jgi:hypothetical protein
VSLKLIYLQYPLVTLAFAAFIYLALFKLMQRRDPWRVLALFAALNILRFAGGAAALAALSKSGAPAFLVQVASGDLVTALLAVATLILLLRRSPHALFAATLMNVVGLLDILVSEGWIGYLELKGYVVRGSFVHGPSIGAALYTAMHLYAFYFIARAGSARATAPG